MMRTSRDIILRLERDGWVRVSQRGSHVKFRHPVDGKTVVVPHPRKDIPVGTLRAICKQAGWS